MNLKNPLLHTSGINSSFHSGNGSFQNYIQHMQNVISVGRIDLTPTNYNKILFANSPFELKPETETRKGILLIHGLYDSPYSLQDIGQHFCSRGFLVRAVLLPGHGTVPGDLLKISYQEWRKAVQFALNDLQQTVDEVYLLGYSLGGLLALRVAIDIPTLKALILLTPALKPKRSGALFLIYWHQFWSLFFPSQNWYQNEKQTSYARYESFTTNAVYQTICLMKETQKLLAKKPLTFPLFAVVTEDDESVSPEAILSFFANQPNPNNRLLLYTTQPNSKISDARIIPRNSVFPKKRIIDFAHTGIPISAKNPHYGEKGDFRDFQHYHYDSKKTLNNSIYFGAITKKNLKKYIIQRLSYNPDWEEMMIRIDEFLKNCGR